MADFDPHNKVSLDAETTGLRAWHGDRAFSFGMSDEDGNTKYFEWKVDPFTREVDPDPFELQEVQDYCENDRFVKVFHHAKFDVRMLEMFGVKTLGRVEDTLIQAKICNNLEPSYNLKKLAAKYVGIGDEDEQDLKDEVKKYRRVAQSYNRSASQNGEPLILLGEEMEMDYWLPRYYDPENGMCQLYCEMDVCRTMGLYHMYNKVMKDDKILRNAYEREMELWHIVKDIEARGMRIREDDVKKELISVRETMEYHQKAMIRTVVEKQLSPFEKGVKGEKSIEDFNPSSAKQLARILYLPAGKGGLGLQTKRTTKAGSLSTDKNTLRELMHEPFVRDLNAFRAADQAISLFFSKFMDLMIDDPISPGEKVLRPGLNQCGTLTYRFSCSDPNLQQVSNPKSSHNLGGNYQARAPFGPRKGYNWYSIDYSQQELRIFADVGKIPFLMQEIDAGRDPNTSTANQVWGGKNNPAAIKAATYALDLGREVPSTHLVQEAWERIGWNAKAAREFGFSSTRSQMVADEWLAEFNYEIVAAEKSLDKANSRQRCKCVLFAKIFGGGPSSVTELLFCELSEAASFMRDLSDRIPEVEQYMKQLTRQAHKDGFIVNPYNRKLRIDRDLAYKCVNYMVQSTAACMMKESIINCHKFLKETGKDAHVLMTIHDELLFEIKKEHAEKWILRNLVKIMSDTGQYLQVPMPVEIKRIPDSWHMKRKHFAVNYLP